MALGIMATVKFLESLKNHFDEETICALDRSLNEEERHCLLINRKKISIDDFRSRFPEVTPHPFIEAAFYYDKKTYDFGKSILHAGGAIYIQDASAMMVSHLLSPKIGETCIDLCAAPGGKTIGASLLMDQNGAIVSNDLSFPRAKELSSNIERLGMGNVIVTSSNVKELVSFYGGVFDNVILDAPCSGSAMFRKNEAAKEDWSEEKVSFCAKTQSELLEQAYHLLKRDGKLIYSTCSFSYEENEKNVIAFLKNHPDMEIVSLPDSPLFYRPKEVKESIYLLPHLFAGEGQYIALFRKKGFDTLETKKKLPKRENNRDLQGLLSNYGIEDPYLVSYNGSTYFLPCPFSFPMSSLRVGVKIKGEEKDHIPDYALSHYLPSSFSIPLSLEETRKYLRGETLPTKEKDGLAILSYLGVNLGFGKIVKGVIKNHYPKGLRRNMPSDLDY